ncbi:MAG: hypothetical protein RH917_15755 [Lacipirellulaceae bacterium]
MNIHHLTRLAIVLALGAILSHMPAAVAQVDSVWIGSSGVPLDWNGSTWTPTGTPPDVASDQIGVINNGGVAFLDSAASATAGGLILGRFDDPSGGTGALEIRSGGSLILQDNGTTNGNISVGTNAGGGIAGTLDILPGGSLTADTLIHQQAASNVNLGGTTAGTATLSLNSALVDGTLSLTGPNVNFTTNSYQMFGASTLRAVITGATHSAINVNGTAILNGRAQVDFSGFSPSVGDSWTLIDAGAVVGNFANQAIETNASLNTGEAFVASRSNGQLNVSLERVLTLQVDLSNGGMTFVNEGSTTLGFDAYSIRSASGVFNVANWNSMATNGFPDFQEANPSANQLGEINPSSAASFASSAQQSLGTPLDVNAIAFQAPVYDGSDLGFSYRRDTDGATIAGIIEVIGTPRQNDLILSIDPTTGNATITNDSYQTIAIDSYAIESASNSLLTSWDSLEDQGGNDWQEASPTVGRLSELLPVGQLTLNPDETIQLDGLWNTSGLQDVDDLTFQFREVGQALGTLTGTVEFLGSGLTADFDNDGDVDANDLAQWQGDYGVNGDSDANGDSSSDGFDFLAWQQQFTGPSAVASAGAVPEPMSATLLLVGMFAFVGRKKH